MHKRIFEEKMIPSHCMEQYEAYEQQLKEKDKEIAELKGVIMTDKERIEELEKEKINMTELKKFAQKITESEFNDKPYRWFPQNLKDEAKKKGIVVVYGQSDDLMEFDGALYDEAGCYDGGTVYLNEDGELFSEVDAPTDSKSIEAIWCDNDSEWTWTYKTDIPHETFEMYDDGEKYCLGFVFYKKDLKQSTNDSQNKKAIECLEEVGKILADAIIEITEPLESLDFADLEKIARCFENKIKELEEKVVEDE